MRHAVLRGGTACFVLADDPAGAQPVLLHWGPDLGADLDVAALRTAAAPPLPRSSYAVDTPRRVVAVGADGWRGRPTLRGARTDGSGTSPRLLASQWEAGPDRVRVSVADEAVGLAVETTYRMHASGVLETSTTVHNTGASPFALAELSVSLPLPGRATELLEPTGRWCRERTPQRLDLGYGARVRESRHGQTGHDAPLVVAAGTPGFSWRGGELWALHLGWSGDAVHWAERHPAGQAAIGAGELLAPGEVLLESGASYAAPPVYAVYSATGLDGISGAFHDFVRARPSHPKDPRPVVLNTWEAVYFDHRLDRLIALADAAAEVGVERFVLDDGWFAGRRDDTAGLGDWYVDPQVWPDGLDPLIAHVRELGMDFGLWVEPEMVNPDSELYRAHPEWLLSDGDRLPLAWRHQHVLDLARPEVYDHLLQRLDALLNEHDIALLKWDHNRDLLEAVHAGRPGVGAKTRALYRLLDELRRRHPRVEIESCASGGGRVDLGILARTDRVWASDTNDPLERQDIQRWTGVLLPPELIGAHVGPPTAHTTGRTTSLEFRTATAFFGHFGIEWDITGATPAERARLAAACAAYKQHRALLASGTVVNGDHTDPAVDLHGVVAPGAAEALFAVVMRSTSVGETPGAVLFPGLDADRTYLVRIVDALTDDPVTIEQQPAPWVTAARSPGFAASGRLLTSVGLPVPVLGPAQCLVLHLSVR
ncbi:MAG TPA: alpha-galactosidase [Mycobacteriales bacterium]|nr:alpha-galactosidase [Mycobacteriales bacterium]